MTTRQRYYVGFFKGPGGKGRFATWFASPTKPTQESHGRLYDAVVGPFRTKRGAVYMSENPSTPSVEQAELWARVEAGA